MKKLIASAVNKYIYSQRLNNNLKLYGKNLLNHKSLNQSKAKTASYKGSSILT